MYDILDLKNGPVFMVICMSSVWCMKLSPNGREVQLWSQDNKGNCLGKAGVDEIRAETRTKTGKVAKRENRPDLQG